MGVGLDALFGLREKDSDGFWVGHSVFQLPVTVQRYAGQAEALVLSYLYQKASGVSFYSAKPIVITLRVSRETIAERTGLSLWAVSEAVGSLEADKLIKVERDRDKSTHQVVLNVYLLLHSTTQEPLLCSPSIWGVCHNNDDRPYVTAPKELLACLKAMQPSGRAVYLAALALASVRQRTSFSVSRDQWKTDTLLGKNSFNRGVKECRSRGLLSYKRQLLTVNDPVTKKPSTRTRGVRLHHEDPRWKSDLDAIAPKEWQKIAERLLNREFTVGASGWTHTRPDTLCPFCKEGRAFTMSFVNSQWKCHHCGAHGRMFQLVQRVRRESQGQRVREYIAETLAPEKEAPDTRTAVLAGTVQDI